MELIKDNDAAPLVPHSYVSASLATHVMYSKFINAMPYHRQEKDFYTQFGIKISRGTMAHWTIFCAVNYFTPLIDYWHRCLSKRRFFGADETPIQVLKESDKRPQSKSYVWLFRSGDDGDAAVTHILGDILLKQFQKGTRRISQIREFRECFTVISSLSMSGLTGKRAYQTSRYITVVKGIKSLLSRHFCRG